MKLPLEIVTRRLPLTESLQAEVRERASGLDQFCDRIMRCRVTIEGPGGHHRKGRLQVKIEMTVPRKRIAVTRQSGEEPAIALREAFNAAGRRLEDYMRRVRRQVKAHEPPSTARVARLFPERGYGFLMDEQGREIYFHRNSVRDGKFETLKVGTEVRYSEELGEEGLQATVVYPIRAVRIRA